MIGSETLMARALRWVVDQNKLTIDSLITIPGPMRDQLEDLAIAVADDMK